MVPGEQHLAWDLPTLCRRAMTDNFEESEMAQESVYIPADEVIAIAQDRRLCKNGELQAISELIQESECEETRPIDIQALQVGHDS